MYNILFITRWYPNSKDPQLGIFVKKHAQAVALYHKVNLIYIESCEQINCSHSITYTKKENFNEFIVKFRKSNYRVTNFVRYLVSFAKTYRYIVKNFGGKPSVVHATILLRPIVLAFILKKIYNIPYVITEHWTGFASGAYNQKGNLYKLITRFVVARAEYITTVSEHLKNDMLNASLKGNYKIIPNVVDISSQNIIELHNKNKAVPTILTVADLYDKKKNISSTIKVISEIIAEGKKVAYHIIGGGEDYAMLIDIATNLGLYNTCIFFHGLQTNEYVYQQLPKCDFAVINSNVETFSVFAAEALVFGKPVIATICGGPEEFITAQTGVLIEKNNNHQLKQALLFMIDHYDTFNSREIMQYASNKFKATEIGKQFSLLYDQIIKHP